MCKRKHAVSLFLDVTGVAMTAAFIACAISFATPYWYTADLDRTTSLVTPYQMPFHSLGLWMLCYRVFPEVSNLLWVYRSSCQYYFTTLKDDVTLPDFFAATQGLFTIGLIICAVGFVVHLVALGLCFAVNRILVVILGCIFLLSALVFSVALIVFAGHIDYIGTDPRNREFVFGWPGNDFGWSFWLGVAGTALLWLASFAYFAEIWRMRTIITVPVDKRQVITTVYYPSGQDFIPYTAV